MSERERKEKAERLARSRDLVEQLKQKAGIGLKRSPYARDPAGQPKEPFSGNAPSSGESRQ